MSLQDYTPEEAAEELRKKHHYRQLILSGKLVLPYRSAARLLGPDCLYQLYSGWNSREPPAGKTKSDRAKPRRAGSRDVSGKGERRHPTEMRHDGSRR